MNDMDAPSVPLEQRVRAALSISGNTMLRARRSFRGVLCAVSAVQSGRWEWRPRASGARVVGLCFPLLRDAGVPGTPPRAVLVLPGRRDVDIEWPSPTMALSVWVDEPVLAEMGIDPFTVPRHLEDGPLTAAARDFLLGLARSGAPQSALADYLTERLAIDMVFGMVIASAGQAALAEHRVPALSRVRTHFEVRCADPGFTLDIAAEELGLSSRQLQRLFRAEGDTPSRVLRALRSAIARDLSSRRADTGMSMKEVARQSGFPSVQAMRRALKAHPEADGR